MEEGGGVLGRRSDGGGGRHSTNLAVLGLESIDFGGGLAKE